MKDIDGNRSPELYRKAFKINPSNHYHLGNYLRYEIANRRDIFPTWLMKLVINTFQYIHVRRLGESLSTYLFGIIEKVAKIELIRYRAQSKTIDNDLKLDWRIERCNPWAISSSVM